MNGDPGKQTVTSDSLGGKILVLILGTVIGGLLLSILIDLKEPIFQRNHPPSASVTPAEAASEIGLPVHFSAYQSADPDGDSISAAWSIAGITIFETEQAACELRDSNFLLICRFEMPGPHTVNLEITDEDGASSFDTATVTVTGSREMLGLVARFISQPHATAAAARVMIHGVDWPAVQETTEKLIILWDPDRDYVRADQIQRNVDRARDALEEIPMPHDISIVTTDLSYDSVALIASNLSEIGIDFVPQLNTAGAVGQQFYNSSFVKISRPNDIALFHWIDGRVFEEAPVIVNTPVIAESEKDPRSEIEAAAAAEQEAAEAGSAEEAGEAVAEEEAVEATPEEQEDD